MQRLNKTCTKVIQKTVKNLRTFKYTGGRCDFGMVVKDKLTGLYRWGSNLRPPNIGVHRGAEKH